MIQNQFFKAIYFHYKDVPKKIIFEKSIAERSKLRRERTNEIKRKEENINNDLFKNYFTNYRSPSDMYGKLIDTKGTVNEYRVYLIKEVLTKMKKNRLKMCLKIRHLRLKRMKDSRYF